MMERLEQGRTVSVCQWLIAALVMSLSLAVAADELPLSETHLKDLGPDAYFAVGEQVTGQACTACHGWDSILASRLTQSQWTSVVDDMVAKGARATTDEKYFIARFMSWAWGKVAVNSAPAEELALVIGLSMKQAEAIVVHRNEHGAFAGLAQLKQVPGIDIASLERQADALQFD